MRSSADIPAIAQRSNGFSPHPPEPRPAARAPSRARCARCRRGRPSPSRRADRRAPSASARGAQREVRIRDDAQREPRRGARGRRRRSPRDPASASARRASPSPRSRSGSSASRIAPRSLPAEIESTRCVRRRGKPSITRASARAEAAVWAPSTRIQGARESSSARPGSAHGGEAPRRRGREHGVGDSRAPDAGERERRVRRLMRSQHGNAAPRPRAVRRAARAAARCASAARTSTWKSSPSQASGAPSSRARALDHAPGRLGQRSADRRHPRLEDARLLARDLLERVAELVRVLELDRRDAGDRGLRPRWSSPGARRGRPRARRGRRAPRGTASSAAAVVASKKVGALARVLARAAPRPRAAAGAPPRRGPAPGPPRRRCGSARSSARGAAR